MLGAAVGAHLAPQPRDVTAAHRIPEPVAGDDQAPTQRRRELCLEDVRLARDVLRVLDVAPHVPVTNGAAATHTAGPHAEGPHRPCAHLHLRHAHSACSLDTLSLGVVWRLEAVLLGHLHHALQRDVHEAHRLVGVPGGSNGAQREVRVVANVLRNRQCWRAAAHALVAHDLLLDA